MIESTRALRTAVVLVLLVHGHAAARGGPACDAGGLDAEAIAATRRAVEAACPCNGFPRHGAYVRCARRVIEGEIGAGRLTPACGKAAGRIQQRSTCSHATPKVTCCEERGGTRGCRVRAPQRCVDGGVRRTACGAGVAFCADTRCEQLPDVAACGPELLYGSEGNRLRRYDLDTIDQPPLVEDVLIASAGDAPGSGRDINGQICAVGGGRFVAGEDTGQPALPPGWGLFEADGTQVGKLTATYFVGGAEPFGCAVDAAGQLFTTEVGSQASGPFNGQLILWFPPYDAASPRFCKLAVDIGTAGTLAIDAAGRVYVASARGGVIHRFSPPFPTGPDAAGGCGALDALGSPLADVVQREVFVDESTTYAGVARAPGGNWFFGSVLVGAIYEYDAAGNRLRTVVAPAPGESTLPFSTGHPQGLAVDCRGNLYYADLALRVGAGGIGPGPNGSVRRVRFDACGVPAAPEIVRGGLAFPDGLGLFAGDLQ